MSKDKEHPLVGVILVVLIALIGASCMKYLFTDQRTIVQETDCGWISIGCDSLDKEGDIHNGK